MAIEYITKQEALDADELRNREYEKTCKYTKDLENRAD